MVDTQTYVYDTRHVEHVDILLATPAELAAMIG